MRAIDADAMLARLEAWNTSDSTDKALYNFTLHRILEQPTIEPDQLPFIVEPEPCCIPFSTMQRVCKHRRTGGIVYGGDAKPRDACHYEMYRSLWDECSMRNCPILNRREIE